MRSLERITVCLSPLPYHQIKKTNTSLGHNTDESNRQEEHYEPFKMDIRPRAKDTERTVTINLDSLQ